MSCKFESSYKFQIHTHFISSFKIMCLVSEYDQYNRNQ